jgi:hypothetical protein
MCWNQYVSINTFVFGIFGLILIFFNNKYSNYKIDFFKNSYAYLFMLSFMFMQLFEFVLWRNLDNQVINKIVSTLGFLLLSIQPIASLLLLNNIQLRNKLLLTYSIPAFIFVIYNILTTNIHTVLSSSGHLAWKWTFYKNGLLQWIIIPFYLFFLFFSLLYNKYYNSLFILLLYFIFIYYFGKDGSSGSIWCLSVNSTVLYFLLQILIVMPYYEQITFKQKK